MKGLRWEVCVACMTDLRNAYKVLDGKPLVMRPLGRLKRRWKENVKIEFRVSDGVWVCEAVSSGPLADCEHGDATSYSINGDQYLTVWGTVSFSRRTLLYEVSL
jgi:hypothetical protein